MTIVERVDHIVCEHESRNPFRISANLDIHILRLPLGEWRGYYDLLKGHHFIVLNEELSDSAARFVCAHELGHYFLHQRFNRVFMDSFTRMNVDRFENEADKFAAHLLFGGAPLYEEAIHAWELAEILNVAVCNVNNRLVELGIYH